MPQVACAAAIRTTSFYAADSESAVMPMSGRSVDAASPAKCKSDFGG